MNFCCVSIKYFAAYLIKSKTVVSEKRIDRKAKASVKASGTTIPVCERIRIESSKATHMMAKSLSDHSQRLAVVRRFYGYK